MDIKIIKFGKTEIEKYKFHQQKNSISIYDLHINKIKKIILLKRVVNISLVTKIIKNLDHYAKSSKNEPIKKGF